MHAAISHPRSIATARLGHRLGGWLQPVHAEVLADFGAAGSERQLAELRPWGASGGVTVSCCSMGGHYDAQTLERDADPRAPTSQQAVQLLAHFFFGPGGLAPRILGPVEWVGASLTLNDADDGHSTLLQLQIRPLVDGMRRAMASCRLDQDGAQKAFLLYLQPADADPLHALLRVAMGLDVDRGFTA